MRHRCDAYRAYMDCRKEARKLDRQAMKFASVGAIESAEICTLSAIEHRKAAARFSLSLYTCGCHDENPPRDLR